MTEQALHFDDLSPLLAALCDGTLDDDGFVRLERLLTTDPAARQWYIAYMDLHGELCWDHRGNEGGAESGERRGLGTSVPSMSAKQDDSTFTVKDSDFAIPPIVIQTLPSPLSSLPSAFGSALFSYLVAVVLVGLGLAIAWVWKLPDNAHIAVQSVPRSSSLVPSPSVRMTFVGRVTGMVDCQWADDSTATINGAHVSLGRKYALASGLMEITYDTGARVILQGPVTYQVESMNGGFLTVGRLTGKVEVAKASGFCVRTPTATVTDVGTEFGIEVNETQRTILHVFRGSVDVEPINRNGQRADAIRLIDNESVEVTRDSGGDSRMVRRVSVPATAFVRDEQMRGLVAQAKLAPFRRWQEYSERVRRDPSLLAYYDFQQMSGSPSVLPNLAANGDDSSNGVVETATWTNGRMPGKHAIGFNGRTDCVKINLHQKVDNLTLAVWLSVDSTEHRLAGILMSDGWGAPAGKVHWQLQPDGGITFGTSKGIELQLPPPTREHRSRSGWTHLALVYDSQALTVVSYTNGCVTGKMPIAIHVPVDIGAAQIGNWNSHGYHTNVEDRGFTGRIDELMIFGRALTEREVQVIFEEADVRTP